MITKSFLSAETMNVGFAVAVEGELNDLKKKDNVIVSQIKVFMKGVQRFVPWSLSC